MVFLSVFQERFVLFSFEKILNLYDFKRSENAHVSTINHEKDIVASIFLPNRQLIVFSDLDKGLFFYDLKTNSYLSHKKVVPKRVVKFISDKSETNVLLADKTGDVYVIDLNNLDSELKLLMGHLSMLLDLILTNDEKFLITCDRDEKIRISNYPNSYNIDSYLLTHREFVRQIELVTNDKLISSSGDELIILWDLNNKIALQKLNINDYLSENEKNASKRGIYRLVYDHNSSNLLVYLFKTKYLLHFKFSNEKNSLSYEHTIELDQELAEMAFLTNNQYIFVFKNGDISIKTLDNDKFNSISNDSLFLTTQNNLKNEKEGLHLLNDEIEEDYLSLFKSKVDNMHDYYDRKAQRLAQKRSRSDSLSTCNSVENLKNKNSEN